MTYAFGILAALAAPLIMTFGFIVWDNHWKGSAFALNLYKCCTASIGFLVLSLTTRKGDVFPAAFFTRTNVGFLMLSSTIGILIGDWTWLEGLRLLGARRVIVVDSIKPLDEHLTGAHFGGMALTVVGILIVSFEKEKVMEEEGGEEGEPGSITSENEGASVNERDVVDVGEEDASDAENNDDRSGHDREDMTDLEHDGLRVEEQPEECDVELTTDAARMPCEIALGHQIHQMTNDFYSSTPMADPASNNKSQRERTAATYRKGYALSVVNVVLDTYGSLLTKEYGEGMTTWEINLIRFGFAGACMLALSLVLYTRQKALETKRKQQNADEQAAAETAPWYILPAGMAKRSWIQVSLGVLLVTFFTPALSNYALFQIALALALTLGSIGPLYALPLSWVLQKERPTLRATFGVLLAVAGIALMSYQGISGDE